MNSRERVRRAITFQRPDRMPYFHRFLDATRTRYPREVAALQARYPGDGDVTEWQAVPPVVLTSGTGTEQVDEWGCLRATGVPGLMGLAVGHPLADWQRLSSYHYPDYRLLDWQCAGTSRSLQPERYRTGMSPVLNPFERMQALRGFAELMLDLAEQRPEVQRLRDSVVDTMRVAVDRWIQSDVDAVGFGDDWGTQQGLMISPEMWRAIFRPAYAYLFEPVKRAGKFVQFHSDGMVLPIIPDLLALGVDILNVQHDLIGLTQLEPFRGQVCFLTQIDSQRLLPYGTPATVRQRIGEVFGALGTPGGGVIGYAVIGPDVPPENMAAVYAAYEELGQQWSAVTGEEVGKT